MGLQIGLLLAETHETRMTGQQRERVTPIILLRAYLLFEVCRRLPPPTFLAKPLAGEIIHVFPRYHVSFLLDPFYEVY